ncbi:MAG: DUF6288 domain-containing protein [Phycisphaerae bacterium]|jgi:hypothetical protein|nr:DUF6288 domain-containing protein [Phycisphaerae bacterium]
MRTARTSIYLLTSCLVAFWVCTAPGAEAGEVEKALSEVRDVKAELFSRKSSVLGALPGPAELATHQMRCRPAPKPKTDVRRDIEFDAEAIKRAAKLKPAAMRKAKSRCNIRALPLGITGAYVTEAVGKTEFLVVHVLKETPAAGVLQLDDIIMGANGRLFRDVEDPRPEMGNALVESQSSELGGKLTLHIVRAGKPLNKTIDLGNTLSYSDTWPLNCRKSKQIRRAALDYVMRSYPWHRYDFWTPTFLMASGDDAALELARRHMFKNLKDRYETKTGASGWRDSYTLINLCEYYLLMGDSAVLPAIRYYAEGLAWAQYRSGSWSHGGGKGPGVLTPGTVGGGYGEINCAGLGAFVGLCLARQCGIEPYDKTLPQSIRFFGKFCGVNFPYGLGNPPMRAGRMDNGMNSMAAVGFGLLGEDEMARRWARSVCYMWMGRERGHAEAIFSVAWGPVGAALAPKEEFHAFMNHMTWAYEMGRARDGGITFMRGGRWTRPNATAAMGLFLYLGDRRLQILGGDSVFAQKPPKGLEKAAQLYKDKKWKELRTSMNDYAKSSKSASSAGVTYAGKLLAAHDRLEKHAAATLKIIEKTIADGMSATAQTQLRLLANMVGAERPSIAALRKKLGDGAMKDPRRPKPQPLVNVSELVKTLKLGKGGIDGGFAHSSAYIARTYKQGFDGMTPEQIAGFFSHCNGGVSEGAVLAMAGHGTKTLPLLKRLLKDTHNGVRVGALAALTEIYESDSKEYRTDVPDELAEIIKMVRPLITDPSPWVRNGASGLVLSMKIVNDDIYRILSVLAGQEGNSIGKFVRYGVKNPRIRTKLCMEMMDTVNRTRSKVPADYKPLLWAVAAHLELCEPYVKVAIDTLNNPEVLPLYGFFSNGPPEAALIMLERYSDNPLVMKHLTDILRFCARKRGSMDSYWYSIVEYPHRIIVKLGPEALPVLEAFCKSERALYQRISTGWEPKPTWWKEDSVEFLDKWCRDMEVTAELVSCLYGKKTPDKAVPPMCEIYLAGRPWSAWERQQIRNRIMKLGVEAIPATLEATKTRKAPLEARLVTQITAKQAEMDDPANKKNKRRLRRELDGLVAAKDELDTRVGELEELTLLIKAFAATAPSAGDIEMFHRFYVKRPWGKQYSFVYGESSYLRPLDEQQLVLIRDTLQRWGKAALPALRTCVEADKQVLAKALAELDKQQAFWEPQRSRAKSTPMARIAVERKDTVQIHAELKDLLDLIECASKNRLSPEEIDVLCRIYTRRDWPGQHKLIGDLLKRQGARAVAAIGKHISSEKTALAAAVADVERYMYAGGKTRIMWVYARAFALQMSIRRGIEGLENISKSIK